MINVNNSIYFLIASFPFWSRSLVMLMISRDTPREDIFLFALGESRKIALKKSL